MTTSVKARIQTSPSQLKEERTSPWKTVLLVVVLQVVAILFVEAVLYCSAIGEEEIFRFDPEIGTTHMHNKRITWRSEGFAQSYLDSDGMREPGLTIAKPADTYRVAVLGDSMVESFHVPLDQTFGAIIAKRLSPISGKQVQWLNFGTSGYSTVQEYLQLKRQVMKYHPDLVIECYNSRDMFENWTAPDEVITNVRPYAVHLPGHEMVIVDQPVRRWLRSPRGQFLVATTWLRENSRIVGLLSALDLELSQHDPWYRAFVDLFSHPKQVATDLKQAFAAFNKGGPSFQINFFEQKQAAAPKASATPKTGNIAFDKQATPQVFNSASGNSALIKAPVAPVAGGSQGAPAGTKLYRELVGRMLTSLFAEMRNICTKGGAKFAVMSVPVRSQLCPLPGAETSFAGIDYEGELQVVQAVCQANHIPYLDVEHMAETLAPEKRPGLFYAVHLTPEGQKFIADAAQPFVREQFGNTADDTDLERAPH